MSIATAIHEKWREHGIKILLGCLIAWIAFGFGQGTMRDMKHFQLHTEEYDLYYSDCEANDDQHLDVYWRGFNQAKALFEKTD